MSNWEKQATKLIESSLVRYESEQKQSTPMLTGVSSAKRLYAYENDTKFLEQRKIDYYFGDEHCVPPDHPDSIYCMVLQTISQERVPKGGLIFRMDVEMNDHEKASKKYEIFLPKSIDIRLLSMGSGENKITTMDIQIIKIIWQIMN
jgi:6-phosphogluconolactonase